VSGDGVTIVCVCVCARVCALHGAELAIRITSRDRRKATVTLHVMPCGLVDTR
jgi:hypothetical protein